jgi:hypothetical protein
MTLRNPSAPTRNRLHTVFLLLLVVCCGLSTSGVLATGEQTKGSKNFGMVLHSNATANDVGLPVYPGSHPDEESGHSAIDFRVWNNGSGYGLTVANLKSADAPRKIARFYQKALRRYGPVLDCSNTQSDAKPVHRGSTDELDCRGDTPSPGDITLKSGTEDKQHVVGIERRADSSIIHLVYVECSGSCRGK